MEARAAHGTFLRCSCLPPCSRADLPRRRRRRSHFARTSPPPAVLRTRRRRADSSSLHRLLDGALAWRHRDRILPRLRLRAPPAKREQTLASWPRAAGVPAVAGRPRMLAAREQATLGFLPSDGTSSWSLLGSSWRRLG